MPKTAQDLIQKTISAAQTVPMPTPRAVRELLALCAHNDALGARRTKRVSKAAACDLLASYGWTGARDALDSVCRRLGRRSFTTP